MKVRIKRIDKSLPLPEYQTKGSVGFDFIVREDTAIAPNEIALIGTNVIIETPPGYMLAVVARSSTAKRKGLLVPHGFGVVDQDYCGPEDEVLIQVYNFGKNKVLLKKGERVAQGLFIRVDKAQWDEVEIIKEKSRGGVGSTG